MPERLNKHKAILALMRVSAFLQKFEPDASRLFSILMSAAFEEQIKTLNQVIDWLETLPD